MINPWTCERCGKPFTRYELTDRYCPRCRGELLAEKILRETFADEEEAQHDPS